MRAGLIEGVLNSVRCHEGSGAHVILTLSGAKGKDLKLRSLRSFAVFAAQDDGG